MSDNVKFEQRLCADGSHQIAIATLNNIGSLNALTFNMLEQLHELLIHWRDDPSIVCVLLEGEGEKAFCAGGDVRAMHDVMSTQTKAQAQEFCTNYFTLEYQCDYLIHTYPKPIIAWGEGIVMGGGMGLFMGASHKVMTPSSRLAMPEVTIGLYPDVGGTWFLNQLDEGIGLFLGLTGVMVNASDAVDIRMADYILPAESRERLIETLQIQYWVKGSDNGAEENHGTVNDVLSLLSEHSANEVEDQKPSNQLIPFGSKIKKACEGNDLSNISREVLAIDSSAHPEAEAKWMSRAQQSHRLGSPISSHLCFRQIKEYQHLSLEQCFRLELGLSVSCGLLGEFQEGVRARLIDKDGEPVWLYKSIESVDSGVIDDLFMSLWEEDSHPLAKLGR
ncbi:enoyl-CoA hydratase/isomerase family protein [Vibrio sp. ZSDE26]|uniref:3-hydroxyisobutyryl-CoA hydrolase n=1 Tax=Vibrio amylolyticus TaxID=2847292 RepID=A0A9X2BL07_9VIBR|nr:enoyl-CoA hydratase/isomerase family protein [Vibrio amylolyticus]MCK6263423.1 enoyl-CoA hydratase/isomerase family protein [Vibrio amylolyticus]